MNNDYYENDSHVFDYDEVSENSLSREIKEQIRAVPWYISSAFAHMVILLLLMLVPKAPPGKVGRDIVIHTLFHEQDQDYDKDSVLHPEDERFAEDIIRDIHETTESVSENLPGNEINVGTGEINTDPEIMDVGDILDGDQPSGEDDSFKAFKPELMAICSSFGNGDLDRAVRMNVSDIGKNLKRGIMDRRDSVNRGLLLVWLLDQSASMKDDQLKIATQAVEIQDLLTDNGTKKMMSAVVAYGKNWEMIQPPTNSLFKIKEKISNAPVDRTGVENTNQAIIFVCQKIMSRYDDYTKVIVLLSDESSSDHSKFYSSPEPQNAESGKDDFCKIRVEGIDRNKTFLEVALKNLIKYKTRLFVIGKESPFQSSYVREAYVDENGKKWPYVRADRGPESPRIEVPVAFSRNVSPHYRAGFTGEIKSGYGVYDLAYLAKGSRGAYFILEDDKTTVRRAMTLSERIKKPLTVDWKVMDDYCPDIISVGSYDNKISREYGRYGRAVVRLNTFYDEMGDKILRWDRARPPSTFNEKLECLKRRQKVISKIISYLKDVRASDKELFDAKNKRQIANIDLFYCVALADQIITDAWLDAWDKYTGSKENYVREGWGSQINLSVKQGAKLSSGEKKLFDERIKILYEACNSVVRRHPNTPYAVSASWIPKGAERWGVPAEMVYQKYKIVHTIPFRKQ